MRVKLPQDRDNEVASSGDRYNMLDHTGDSRFDEWYQWYFVHTDSCDYSRGDWGYNPNTKD